MEYRDSCSSNNRKCFADLGFILRTLPYIYTNSFRIIYWHVNFHDLNPKEMVWNVIKRSHCLTINLAHYSIQCGGTNYATV